MAATRSPDGSVDLREHFAFPLPVAVICHVLGVPDSAVAELRSRFDRLVTPQVATGDDGIRLAVANIYSFLSALIEWKRTDPGDDLTTALIHAWDDGTVSASVDLTPGLPVLAGSSARRGGKARQAYAALTR